MTFFAEPMGIKEWAIVCGFAVWLAVAVVFLCIDYTFRLEGGPGLSSSESRQVMELTGLLELGAATLGTGCAACAMVYGNWPTRALALVPAILGAWFVFALVITWLG